jgi:hydroxymethylpyrimidine/phosphomethylpyrimidine kinase
MPRALTIAGSDSGGGAGIQADLKTFSAFGVYGMSVITALTAQNTLGVQGVLAVPPDFVALQFRSVVDDLGVDALKTGMLGDAAMVERVVALLADAALDQLVVDPVMIAKGGAALLTSDAIDSLKRLLLPQAMILTPNLPEAAALLGCDSLDSERHIREAARALHAMGPRHVIMKGGHLPGDELVDLLYDGQSFSEIRSRRIHTRHTHGTGCSFAAALTALLARGEPVARCFVQAHAFVRQAIASNPGLGAGHGPLNHHFRAEGLPGAGLRAEG